MARSNAQDVREELSRRDNILKFGVPISEELLNALTEIGFPFQCSVTTLVPAILWEYVHLYNRHKRTRPGPLDALHNDKEAPKQFQSISITKVAKEALKSGG